MSLATDRESQLCPDLQWFLSSIPAAEGLWESAVSAELILKDEAKQLNPG